MTIDDDELFRLNSLHRFEKHSKLAMEAHSSCEAPAGCGGAVLEWFRPELGAPLRVSAIAPGYACHVRNGADVRTSRVRYPPGEAVLAFRVTPPRAGGRPEPGPPFLLVDVVRDRPTEPERLTVTRGNGSWRMTTVDPGEGWSEPGFDHLRWQAMVAAAVDPAVLPDYRRTMVEEMLANGAVPLAIPADRTVWVRSLFRVPPWR